VVETTVYRKDLHPETMVQKCRVDVDSCVVFHAKSLPFVRLKFD